MQKLNQGVDSFIKAMLGNLAPQGKAWARVGIVVMICAAVMSFKFGWNVSGAHATFLAALTFIAAFGPEAAHNAIKSGKNRFAGVCIALACVPVLAAEFYSHSAYTAGLRGSNLEDAKVQNARYDGAQEGTKEEKANLDIWRKQLADLQGQWPTTVKAEALREDLKNIDGKIEWETKGGRDGRAAGCKKVCEQLKDDRAKLVARIAATEKADDLTKRIEATQRILDGKRTVAAKTEFKSSAVAHQDASLSKWVSLITAGTVKPDDFITETSHESANFLMALMGTGLPALSIIIAGLYRLRDDEVVEVVRSQPLAHVPANTNAAPVSTTYATTVFAEAAPTDERIAQWHEVAKSYAAKLPVARVSQQRA